MRVFSGGTDSPTLSSGRRCSNTHLRRTSQHHQCAAYDANDENMNENKRTRACTHKKSLFVDRVLRRGHVVQVSFHNLRAHALTDRTTCHAAHASHHTSFTRRTIGPRIHNSPASPTPHTRPRSSTTRHSTSGRGWVRAWWGSQCSHQRHAITHNMSLPCLSSPAAAYRRRGRRRVKQARAQSYRSPVVGAA
jgi:hypothetical protein